MFKVPEKYRLKDHPFLGSDESFGNAGVFIVPVANDVTAYCIASDGEGWEHVSLHVVESDGSQQTPAWEEMCEIKDLFWDAEDTVIQYHPPHSEHVNNHKHCLHLWRPVGIEVPRPPAILVGTKAKTND